MQYSTSQFIHKKQTYVEYEKSVTSWFRVRQNCKCEYLIFYSVFYIFIYYIVDKLYILKINSFSTTELLHNILSSIVLHSIFVHAQLYS